MSFRSFFSKFVSLSVMAVMVIQASFPVHAEIREVEYNRTFDIRNDFCGVHIRFQFCKCAFHNEYCGSVGLDQDSANSKVQADFDAWVNEQRQAFVESCGNANGKMKGQTICQYCDAPNVWAGSRCVSEEGQAEAEKQDRWDELMAGGLFNEDCSLKTTPFDRDWEKYSDIDDAIPLNERSTEAQQYTQLGEQLINKTAEAFQIEHDMELDRQARLAMREYRQALVNDLKTNLLKAFWRLAYVTYSTTKAGKGLGESYTKVLQATEASAPVIGEGLSLVQSLIPGDSQLAIDTKTEVGKIKSITLGAELEALKTGGNPRAVAMNVMTSIANLPIPGADISPEEVAVLQNQNDLKMALDDALQESYKENALRRQRLMQLEEEIEDLQEQVLVQENAERGRVQNMLQAECEEVKKALEDSGNDGAGEDGGDAGGDSTSWLRGLLPSGLVPTALAQSGSVQLEEGLQVPYDDMITADTDGNGQEDRWSYYQNDELVLTEYDTDADGKKDLWMHYNDWTLDLEATDIDGDEQPDSFLVMSADEEVQSDELEDFSIESGYSGGVSKIYVFGGVAALVILLLLLFARRRNGSAE